MQGPHQVAQKSITTGLPEAMMSLTFSSVNVVAIIIYFIDNELVFQFIKDDSRRYVLVKIKFERDFKLFEQFKELLIDGDAFAGR